MHYKVYDVWSGLEIYWNTTRTCTPIDRVQQGMAVWYLEEVLDLTVRLHAVAVAHAFILIHERIPTVL